ncbi:hypothetical protein CYI63_RS12430, partial [Vibrio parahaemolyticus]|nr:hypothetical protein [Vibrio parahaemolyticus]
RSKNAEDIKFVARELSRISIHNNPFSCKKYWRFYSAPNYKNAINKDCIESGDTLIRIDRFAENSSGNRTNFLFSKDDKGEEYFVHFDSLKNCDWQDWLKLGLNEMLVVKDFSRVDGKRALNVNSCLLVES